MGRGGYNGVASKVHARTGTACMPTIQVSFGRGGYNSTARSAVPDSPQASHEPSSPTITTPTARDNSWRPRTRQHGHFLEFLIRGRLDRVNISVGLGI
ncbi:MAG: hypothetical protein FRX48_08983 [Lasallia pustulata]|uniref:Uncharacterized protein n=1 Tax=Lasallia pustulata TaxID=136370 RepID=A0A5M8PD28_9LECA|nr:MAG: hypothetical protein FRX48_08983 [Lasallia pustulata]